MPFDNTTTAIDLLDIPAFLRRGPTKPVRTVTRAKRLKPEGSNGHVWLHLHEEAPRIGSGFRSVKVKTVGRKFVTVQYWPGGDSCHYINHRFMKRDFYDAVARANRVPRLAAINEKNL